MPRQPAKVCPEGQRYCPDCAAEGIEGCRPLDEFGPPVKAARYKGGVRYPAYCKRHAMARAIANKRNAPPESPQHESQRRAEQAYYQRHKDDPAFQERRRAISAAYRKRNPEKTAAVYKSWLERNRETRRRSIRAWRERRRTGQDTPPSSSEATDE